MTMTPDHAAARWRELLAEEQPGAEWFATQRQQIAAALSLHGESVLNVAAPRFVTAQQRELDERVVRVAGRALTAAGRLALGDRAVGDRYLGDARRMVPDDALRTADPGYRNELVVGRFDGVRADDGLRIIEFNGGLPGGVRPMDAGAQLMSGWPVFQRFVAEQRLEHADMAAAVVRAWVAAWHDFGGDGPPFLVLAMPAELAANDAYAATLGYFVDAARREGLEVAHAEPGDLRHSEGALRLDGRPVDLLVRAFFTSMFATLGERVAGIASAVCAGDVCMITSVREGFYGAKALFAIVTDSAFDLGLSDEEALLLRRHMPWTRLLAAGETTGADGGTIDLLPHVRAERDHLVIKPSGGTGGAGVELGWEHDAAGWEAAVSDALAKGGYVVQERLPLPVEEYPLLEPGFPERPFTVDYNPVVCDATIAGYYVRATGHGSLTSLTAGTSSVVPAFELAG